MVEVIYDRITGKSRGFGFVTMSTVEEVEAAARQFNGYEFKGRMLRVNSGPPPPREERPSSGFRSGRDGDERPSRGFRSGRDGDEHPSRGFRSGRDGDECPSRGFRSGRDGERDFRSGRDGDERPSRNFRSGRDGDRDFRSGRDGDERPSRGFRSGREMEDRPSRSFRSGGGSGGFDAANRLFIGNLSWGVDNSALETIFSEQGRVMDARVVYDRESGRSRGFGFVSYSTSEEANNAISTLDGSDLDGRSIRVTMAEARPERREF